MKFYKQVGNRPINKNDKILVEIGPPLLPWQPKCVFSNQHAGESRETRRHALLLVEAVLRRVIYGDSPDGATRHGQCQCLGGGLCSPTAF